MALNIERERDRERGKPGNNEEMSVEACDRSFFSFSVFFFSFLHDDDDRRKVHQAQDSPAVHASLYLGKIELEVRAQP